MLPRPSPRYYVPSVMLPAEAAKSPATHKIHILGEDDRSKFIAHALSGVYDSVEMIGWRGRPASKYPKIIRARRNNGQDQLRDLRHVPRVQAADDDSHIDQLVVSGPGIHAADALDAVKHRVDENTAICVMNDGLGVLEDVRQKFFRASKSRPDFFLGHMSHRLAYNRKYDAVKQLTGGQLQLSRLDTKRTETIAQAPHYTENRTNFVETLQQVSDLRTTWTPYDQWLRFKLPSVLFGAAIEPVCVLFDMSYDGLLQNPPARRMMFELLNEITMVLDNLPELEGSTVIRDFTHGKALHRVMYGKIVAKRNAPSQLLREVSNGIPTDIKYMNGYFLRRAKTLGIDLPRNRLMEDMVKAKHSQSIERRNSHIPMEETSIPSEESFRMRASPSKFVY